MLTPPLRLILPIALCLASGAQAQDRPAPRRRVVTAEHERSAFADQRARTLLQRARAARLAQDSALRSYDAKSFLRISLGLGLRRLGRERLLMRTEHAARVQWGRGSGVWIQPTGRRTAFPMGGATLDLTQAMPIPYFPGREALWIPSSEMNIAQAEVNENDMLHPLAGGAEAYYRYATGDSMSMRLPDGRTISLRELRITPRKPEWRAFVGSFWFDVERGSLVRAAYRLAADLDLWQSSMEEHRRRLEELEARARTDTGAAARATRRAIDSLDLGVRERLGAKLMEGTFTPARMRLSAVTVEYGLYGGRFWLPKLNVAEGEMRAGFMRIPMKWEESFRYASVNGGEHVPPVPLPGQAGLAPDDSTWVGGGSATVSAGVGRGRTPDTSSVVRLAREDSLVARLTATADSIRVRAEEARAKGDTAAARGMLEGARYHTARAHQIIRRRAACRGTDSTYLAGIDSRYKGALRMAIRMPCDTSGFAHSPDLPGSIYESGEEVFGTVERDALLESLDLSLQPSWSPQPPVFRMGLADLRYNRVEALSLGASVRSELGLGYAAEAKARIGIGDWVPNGELSLTRSNGRSELRLTGFHRLGVANDDWGSPLSPGASLANLLYARDEGFYYRTWGLELGGVRDAPGPLGGAAMTWRLFAERHRSAGVEPNTQASLAGAIGSARFDDNIDAVRSTALGGAVAVARSFGANPRRARLDTRFRIEGALTDRADSLSTTGYARGVVDGTVSRPVGSVGVSLTGAAGSSAGDLPVQRAFSIGGMQTVRGQFARSQGEGRVGDAFWLGRAEVGLGTGLAMRPSLFYDIGWAGARADFAQPGRPLSGAGVGVSLLDGLVRFDAARGIWPERRWRFDVYLDARF